MAYKRNTDRLPIIPCECHEENAACHYCIVGCGYHAYTWPVNQQGGPEPENNAFGVDLTQQQGAETEAWYSPSMYNIVKQDGRDVHMVIKPDANCSVNSGLASIRGAPHGRDELFLGAPDPAAAPDRSARLALRPDAADQLGGRADLVARVTAGSSKVRARTGCRAGIGPWRCGGGYESPGAAACCISAP